MASLVTLRPTAVRAKAKARGTTREEAELPTASIPRARATVKAATVEARAVTEEAKGKAHGVKAAMYH